ncbi:MAG: hypothetical protein LBL80_05435 [Ruminococcus sp.]|jgi:hypothetical protein|nr:hypothetical protein [Ruminococcus sp.]
MAKRTGKTKFTIDKKLSIPIFILMTAAAIYLRTYQLINNTNLDTGIFINRGLQYDYPVWAIAGGMLLILLLLIFGKSEDRMSGSATLYNPMNLPIAKLNKNFKGGSAAAILVSAGAILFGIVMSISFVARENGRINDTISDEDLKIPALTGLTAVDWISYVLMVFTIITLITVAVNMFKGDGFTKLNCFFLVAVPILKALEIYTLFFKTIEEARIINLYSEMLYQVFSGIATVFFMIYLIRVFGGMEEKGNRIALLFWGYLAAVLLITSILPQFLCFIILPYDQIGALTLPSIEDVGLAILCLVVIKAFFADFAYREMAKMTYKEGRRDHWISALAQEENEMEELKLEDVLPEEKPAEEIVKNTETNVDDLY